MRFNSTLMRATFMSARPPQRTDSSTAPSGAVLTASHSGNAAFSPANARDEFVSVVFWDRIVRTYTSACSVALIMSHAQRRVCPDELSPFGLLGPSHDQTHTTLGNRTRACGHGNHSRTSESSTVRCSFGGASNSDGLSTFAAVATFRGAEGEPCSLASASLAACGQQPHIWTPAAAQLCCWHTHAGGGGVCGGEGSEDRDRICLPCIRSPMAVCEREMGKLVSCPAAGAPPFAARQCASSCSVVSCQTCSQHASWLPWQNQWLSNICRVIR